MLAALPGIREADSLELEVAITDAPWAVSCLTNSAPSAPLAPTTKMFRPVSSLILSLSIDVSLVNPIGNPIVPIDALMAKAKLEPWMS